MNDVRAGSTYTYICIVSCIWLYQCEFVRVYNRNVDEVETEMLIDHLYIWLWLRECYAFVDVDVGMYVDAYKNIQHASIFAIEWGFDL